MSKPALEIINTESNRKAYIDPQSAEVIIEMIADMKRKVAHAEELLAMMEKAPAEQ